MRYFIELSYLGKNYHGWQKQPNAKSIQETLENALTVLLRKEISVMGCGRTDTGVHARQFYAHFDFIKDFNEYDLVFKLNSYLPEDISIHRIFLVGDEAHARFDAVSRKYKYHITLSKNPFLIDTALYLKSVKLDINKMNKAASLLFEYKNFKCFSRSNTDVKTYNCNITEAVWLGDADELVFFIKADRFLRNMVRAIVGTLIEVGKHRLTIEEFRQVIESQDRTKAGASVKAKGLFLTHVEYPKNMMNIK